MFLRRMPDSDDQNSAPPAAPPPEPSPRRRPRKSESSSSSSSSDSSSSSSDGARKRRRRRRDKRKRGGKRERSSNRKLDELYKEVNLLREQLSANNNDYLSDVSRDLYNNNELPSLPVASEHVSNENSDFNFQIQTKLKEPTIPTTSDSDLKLLHDLQLFDNKDWSELRYSDTQKLYQHSPGFIDLEANEEVKIFDTLKHLTYADKSYAALTLCILKQREALQCTLNDLLNWARESECVNYESLKEKISILFSDGDFPKRSSDLLQLACGHRAEVIQSRRDGIINQVKDPLMKTTLKKIPPSCKNLFNAEAFTSAVEKAGGVRKCFWPSQKKKSTNSASQARLTGASNVSSQGTSFTTAPPQGAPYYGNAPYMSVTASHSHHVRHPPPQGGCNYQCSSQEYQHVNPHSAATSNQRGSFRGHPSRQGARSNDQYPNNRKRGMSSSNSRGGKKRRY